MCDLDIFVSASLRPCDCDLDLSVCDLQLTPGSCVSLQRPEHSVSAEGGQHAALWGTLSQTAAGLTPGAVYRLTLRLAHPLDALANQRPASGHVTLGDVVTPFQLDPSLCRGLCDVTPDSVMLWHRSVWGAGAGGGGGWVCVAQARGGGGGRGGRNSHLCLWHRSRGGGYG